MPLKPSSYFETPVKYKNKKFGLINIRNKNGKECFKFKRLLKKSSYR